MRIVLVLVAALLVAGCASPSPSTPPSTSSSDVQRAAIATPTAGPANATGNASSSAALVPFTSTVSYTGKTDTGACVFAVAAAQCAFPQPGTGVGHKLAFIGKPASIGGSVTYSAPTPGSSFSIGICQKLPNVVRCMGKTLGASPAKFEFDLSAYNRTDDLLLGIDNSNGQAAPPGVGAFVWMPADFKVDATQTELVAPRS